MDLGAMDDFPVPLRVVGAGPRRTDPALDHAAKRFGHGGGAHVDVDDDGTDGEQRRPPGGRGLPRGEAPAA